MFSAIRHLRTLSIPGGRHALIFALLSIATAACGLRREPPPAASVEAPHAAPLAAREMYVVDGAASELAVLVHRSGPLARLGHDHVLVSHALAGTITVDGDALASDATFDLTLPVASFEIDAPAERAARGPDFATIPSAEDVAGTRRNMLGAAVLDAEHYPDVHLNSLAIGGDASDGANEGRRWNVRLRAFVAGHASDVDVEATVETTPDGLVVTVDAPLSQTALGLQPFSIGFGALRVDDRLDVHCRLVAHRAGGRAHDASPRA